MSNDHDKIIKIEEQQKFLTKELEINSKEHGVLSEKLQQILIKIIETDANREADLLSLKISIKNKINDVNKETLAKFEDHKKTTEWTVWLYNHQKFSFTMIAIFIFTSIDKFISVYNLIRIQLMGI